LNETKPREHIAGATALLRLVLLSATARLLLRTAIVCLRVMQWLYSHRLIGVGTADRFFQAARRLDRCAWLIASEQTSTPPANDRF
jgi:hypothetical protein